MLCECFVIDKQIKRKYGINRKTKKNIKEKYNQLVEKFAKWCTSRCWGRQNFQNFDYAKLKGPVEKLGMKKLSVSVRSCGV